MKKRLNKLETNLPCRRISNKLHILSLKGEEWNSHPWVWVTQWLASNVCYGKVRKWWEEWLWNGETWQILSQPGGQGQHQQSKIMLIVYISIMMWCKWLLIVPQHPWPRCFSTPSLALGVGSLFYHNHVINNRHFFSVKILFKYFARLVLFGCLFSCFRGWIVVYMFWIHLSSEVKLATFFLQSVTCFLSLLEVSFEKCKFLIFMKFN